MLAWTGNKRSLISLSSLLLITLSIMELRSEFGSKVPRLNILKQSSKTHREDTVESLLKEALVGDRNEYLFTVG